MRRNLPNLLIKLSTIPKMEMSLKCLKIMKNPDTAIELSWAYSQRGQRDTATSLSWF